MYQPTKAILQITVLCCADNQRYRNKDRALLCSIAQNRLQKFTEDSAQKVHQLPLLLLHQVQLSLSACLLVLWEWQLDTGNKSILNMIFSMLNDISVCIAMLCTLLFSVNFYMVQEVSKFVSTEDHVLTYHLSDRN